MVTYLNILNDARAEIGGTPLSTTGVANGSAESLSGIRAINKVLAKIYKLSVDQDFASKNTTVTLTSGNNQLTSPVAPNLWDSNTLQAVYYYDSAQRYALIQLPSKQEADNLLFNLQQSGNGDNFPKWWYVDSGDVFVLPVPTSTYIFKIYYLGILFSVASTDMSSTIDMPPDFLESFRLGTEAYLRKVDKDPEWPNLEAAFLADLKVSFQRNKFNAKNSGLQMYQMRRSASARL